MLCARTSRSQESGFKAIESKSIDLTGWQLSPLRYHHQKPHDLPLESRFKHDPQTDTYTFWVEKGDKPHQPPPNRTAPRSELRFADNPTTAAAMFDADVFITSGTHTCIMQVFGGQRGPDAMLMVRPSGNIHYGFGNRILARGAYEKWINFKVINDPRDGGNVQIYVNGDLVQFFVDGELTDKIPCRIDTPHYFKCGAYSVRKGDRSEVKWRNIKYWIKPLETEFNSTETRP